MVTFSLGLHDTAVLRDSLQYRMFSSLKTIKDNLLALTVGADLQVCFNKIGKRFRRPVGLVVDHPTGTMSIFYSVRP